MIAVQHHGNVWMVVHLNSKEEVVSVVRSFRRQEDAHRLLMALYDKGFQ